MKSILQKTNMKSLFKKTAIKIYTCDLLFARQVIKVGQKKQFYGLHLKMSVHFHKALFV